MNGPVLTLNSTWLRNRLAELGVKQWWLAEQLGVDRRTVMRWVNGQVRQIRADNAARLALVLDAPLQALLLDDQAPALATVQDQRDAGLALAGARLLDRLGPVHQWDVAERLLKAIAVPDLPLDVLGSLYHQVCVACWRQDKLDEAARHNTAALSIAERSGDHALRAQALGSRANLRYWRGDVAAALADWREALALARWLEPRERGSLHSNLGAALYETGDLAAGRREIERALQLFAEDGTAMQLSIARAHLALIALQAGDLATARSETQRSEALAGTASYRRGLAFARRLHALVHAEEGDADSARQALAQSDSAFAELGIDEALNHRLAAQVWRLLGEADLAQQALQRGFAAARGFPLEHAALLAEQAACHRMSLGAAPGGR